MPRGMEEADVTPERQGLLPLTDAGRVRLREELDHLRGREPELRAHLQDEREQSGGDGAGAYRALEDLVRVQQRILQLEAALTAEGATAASPPDGTVSVGSRVTARDEGGRVHTFVIVSPMEADAGRGHISASSPVGVALLGRRAGAQTTVSVPTGTRTFTVLSVE